MKILASNPGHDGSIAFLRDKNLVFCYESEKNSFPRFSDLTITTLLDAAESIDVLPDILAVGGYNKYVNNLSFPLDSGYYGTDTSTILSRQRNIFGQNIKYFSSSHERSHILCSYGLSPFPKGEPCYALVWEGKIGNFYQIDESMKITNLGQVMTDPGVKYSYIYALANENIASTRGRLKYSDAGKLMALTSFSKSLPLSNDEEKLIDFILNHENILSLDKADLINSPMYNIGVESELFKNFAKFYSDKLFDKFYNFAKNNLTKKLPLLISGGCGLNCDWNSNWQDSNLFTKVFIPPVTNDSGCAIGTAIDAQWYYTGDPKVTWDVYCGKHFDEQDISSKSDIKISNLDYYEVANFLNHNKIIAWVQDRMEIGPRALGNRSIIAAPFSSATQKRLNFIKKREQYRPVAPICIEEDAPNYFQIEGRSPYMLFFQKLRTDKLQAITHVDGSARIQTVNQEQNPKMYALLQNFKKITGFSVLCNTSLNFNGMGFINNSNDLYLFCKNNHLDGCVINDKFYSFS